jgi:hypothetical protein
MTREFFSNLPQSVCTCGHVGDGANSQHKATVAEGHGACMVRECKCKRFTWKRYMTLAEQMDYGQGLNIQPK